MRLTDLLGHDDAEWMSDPNRRCATPAEVDHPLDIRLWADMWLPANGGEIAAKTLCCGCPVANSCLTYALERPELEGIWGGTTTTERARTRNPRKQPDSPSLPIVTRDSCGTLAGHSTHKRYGEHVCDDCRDTWNAYRRDWRNGKKVVA